MSQNLIRSREDSRAHLRSRKGFWLPLLLVLSTALGVAGCKHEGAKDRSGPSAEARADDEGDDDSPRKKKKNEKGAESGGAAKTTTATSSRDPSRDENNSRDSSRDSENYFSHPEVAVLRIKEKSGCSPCRALEIVLYPDRAQIQLQDSAKPLNADAYSVNGGQVGSPAPIEFHGDAPTVEGMKANTFDMDKDLAMANVATMIATAGSQTKLESPSVTHAVVKRDLPFSDILKVRVFLKSTRRSGFVDFSADGKVVKVSE